MEATHGPVLVLAGAGTGKTRVITARIAHLLKNGARPEQILAVTFTNKAAREMGARVAKMVGKKNAAALTVCTFHSFCARLLRREGNRVDIRKNFTLCDSADQLTTVKGVLRELRVPEKEVHPRATLSRISLWKNQLVPPEKALDLAADVWEETVARAYARYEAQLRRTGLLDFDDLLIFTMRLLQEHEEVRQAYGNRFQWIMVDEYQDTNGPQYQILHLLAKDHQNICVVGDDDQSIYGWRGADVKKILGFENDYPSAKVVRLETNYRSTSEILEAANALIRQNIQRHDKALHSALGSGVPINWLPLFDELNEANFVVAELKQAVERGETHWQENAILFRTQTQPRTFEAELRRQNVPYRLAGTHSFFDRKEVRDILAFLKLMENPDDEVSLLRIINVPPRGVGKGSIEKMVATATEQGVSLGKFLGTEIETPSIQAKALDASKGLVRGLAKLKSQLDNSGDLPGAVQALLRRIEYRREVDRCYDDQITQDLRWQGVEEIVNFAENHARSNPKASLASFLEDLTLDADEDKEEEKEEKNAVTLMTLHASKGLEFPRVYLVGFEEGLLPHARAADENGVEEERRLAYVGFTRAKRMLTITWTEQRTKWGRPTKSHVSRFYYETIGETPPNGWMPTGQEPAPRPASRQAGRKKSTKGRGSSRKQRS